MKTDRDLADRMPVYLDYAATTPVDPAVANEMFACLTEGGDFGNARRRLTFLARGPPPALRSRGREQRR